jgi:CheY-like chemotaxis protein
MPSMDGYEVAKLIILIQKISFPALQKQLGYGRAKAKFECPVVAVTAY